MKAALAGFCLVVFPSIVFGQDSLKRPAAFTVSGYGEIYYGYDLNRPANGLRPSFVYSHNRHNQVDLNLGYLKAAYNGNTVRGNFALMAGTYATANLANEKGIIKNIFEANAGIKLLKNSNLWLDAGIFASHIGFESAVSKDCWALTRNIASDNTPYYESGAKVTYITPDNNITLSALLLNGWQRVKRQAGNNKAAGGLQALLKLNDRVTLNYSNYLGTEGADSIAVTRFYNNFYGIFQLSKALGLTAGFDYGSQQQVKGSSHYLHIIAPVAIVRYQIRGTWAVAGRAEYYQDRNGIFINTGTLNGFSTTAYSANVDFAPFKNALLRLEGKTYNSNDKVFIKNGLAINTDSVITTSFAVSF